MPSTRRALLTAGAALFAGCAGGVGSGSDDTPAETATDNPTTDDTPPATDETPTGTIEFPDGPKERPERPDELTTETVRQYVLTHERRYAYNALYYDESSEVSLTCEVLSVEPAETGYHAVVQCTGYSNSGRTDTDEVTGTPTIVHADWGSQRFRYHVTADATTRRRVERY